MTPGTSLGGLRLGAPGVYPVAAPSDPSFQAVRLDVTGFVGVALRGPVDTPVLVTSWTDYRRRFGGFEGPVSPRGERAAPSPDRMLPYAVQAFFAQGGVRAYVVRVAAPEPAPGAATAATTSFELRPGAGAPPVVIEASDEGSWSNRLSVRLEFEVAQAFRPDAGPQEADELLLPAAVALPAGSLVRVRRADLPPAGSLHWVVAMRDRTDTGGSRRRVAVLEPPLPLLDESAARPADTEVAVVTGVLVVDDHDPRFARSERIAGLGLRPGHPRFVGAVLGARPEGTDPGDPEPGSESFLVRAIGPWAVPLAPTDALLPSVRAALVRAGTDRWESIDALSFFDSDGAAADPLGERPTHRGVDAMGRVSEIGLLCVPDLAWHWQGKAPDPEPAEQPGACAPPWEPQLPPLVYALPPAPPARLDSRDAAALAELVRRQRRCIEVAELRRRFVLLLDVPTGLATVEITRWRTGFDSSYAAAYHPWLGVPRVGERRSAIVEVPPSAFAAGIVAEREHRLGLPWGPANELARAAVVSSDAVSDAEHDQLHLVGVNVFRAERDGFRLTAARTLSLDPDYRQLSVRRLMTMLASTLERQSQWLVFEPNTAQLRTRLTRMITELLRDLHRRGAFAGDSEEQSFFVRCDDRVNPTVTLATGHLVAEVGVAPASPLEYLVLRIAQDADGGLAVEAGRG